MVKEMEVLWDDSIKLQEKVRSAYYAADIGLGSTVWFRFPFRVKPRHKKTSKGAALYTYSYHMMLAIQNWSWSHGTPISGRFFWHGNLCNGKQNRYQQSATVKI